MDNSVIQINLSRKTKITGISVLASILVVTALLVIYNNNNNNYNNYNNNNGDDEANSYFQKRSTRTAPTDPVQHAIWLQQNNPFIDGHNDMPNEYRILTRNRALGDLDITVNRPGLETDIPRLRKGMLGAQFWSVFTNCTFRDYPVQVTLENIDTVYRMVQNYSNTFQLAYSAADVYTAFSSGKIASLMGMEGGHSVNSSMAVIRMFHRLGVRYMTLTHVCNTEWAQSANDAVQTGRGLTAFGKEIVLEMNRVGMTVDISHVSAQTMRDALATSLAPVMFSHSNVYSIVNNARNAPDDVLQALKVNNGVLMLVFVPQWLCTNWGTASNVTCNVSDLIRHIDYISQYIGVDHVGIGSAFEGVHIEPVGIEDTSKFINITVELVKHGYSDTDIIKIMGGNVMRVLGDVEKVAAQLQQTTPPSTTQLYGNINDGPPATAGPTVLPPPPTCGLTVQIVYESQPWVSNGITYQTIGLYVLNGGSTPLTSLTVSFSGGPAVTSPWNLSPVGPNWSLNLWGGLAVGSNYNGQHGFIAQGNGVLHVSIVSAVC